MVCIFKIREIRLLKEQINNNNVISLKLIIWQLPIKNSLSALVY